MIFECIKNPDLFIEGFVINEKDLYVNFDKFESGKSNVLLITGLSGSGKSTLAESLAKKYKCENFELDCLDFYLGGYMDKNKAKKYEPALYDFIEKKHLEQDKDLSSIELYKEYIRFIISWCKKNIKSDDVFMYLGDMSYRWINDEDREEVKKIFKSLPGIKILIIGNHDEFSDGGDYQDYGFRYAMKELKWQNYIFTHKPINVEDMPGIKNIHGHMHKWTEYNTTDGKNNVNVYPSFYNNQPVTLDYLLNNFDKLTKDNKRSNWNGMGESTIDLGDITNENYNLITEARDMINKLLNNKSNNLNEWSMAACNPVIGIAKPYILKAHNDSDSLIKSTVYALSTDIIADKYLVVDENCKLSIVSSSFFDNYIIEKVYEFTGNPLRVAYIAEAYYNNKQVQPNYIYETLSGKNMLSDDQIDFDESFSEVLIDSNNIDSIIATIKEQWNQINNKDFSLPVVEAGIKFDDNISILEDANGYYARNNLTKKRTASVADIDSLTKDYIKSIY